MRTRLTVAFASLAGLLIGVAPVMAHHSFAAEYRRDQADQAHRDGDEDRVDKSPLLLLHRCKERGIGQNRELGARAGQPQRAPACGLDAQLGEHR